MPNAVVLAWQMLFYWVGRLPTQGGNDMPSVASKEIVRRIPHLTPDERKQLINFLHSDARGASDLRDHAAERAEQNGTAASPVRLVPIRSFDEEREWISQHFDQYRGQFVALSGNRLIAHGCGEGEVIVQARLAGFQSPYVTYIETEAEEHYLSGWLNPVLCVLAANVCDFGAEACIVSKMMTIAWRI
jgi:hypothetical protein